ncbi:hypothetical protein CVT25_015494 [Psilocybe cyanescens]|uniref:Helicase C-terminal domain-containing protein n=1 Tax=Psilocybe cyanescens TaxID=93625 RepID=A0A409WI61_PSICY|nr:hypothetical protein CVT25_015494 [Psilocybe cyanescens]
MFTRDNDLNTRLKLYKAINVVLAFVSSKRQLATSFSAIRTSVEGILKQPLEISKVSEIKALLPDLLKFSYVPVSDLQVNENFDKSSRSVDYSEGASSTKPSQSLSGHVLVMDFEDKTVGKRDSSSGNQSLSVSLSPVAVKKLIEARNGRFEKAIHELIVASSADDDPVSLLITAGRNYVPVDHSITLDSKKSMEIPTKRPTIDQIIADIMASVWYKDQIVYRRLVEAKEMQIGSLDPPISQNIANAVLQSRNIQSLYSHQAAAIQAIRRGKHVVVSTSTASGKSVIYQIPLLAYLNEDLHSTAILVFPTKALAQDQKASLSNLFQICPGLEHLKVATYDGDTPYELRTEIRDTASVILTNFDTLHASILPNEEKWRSATLANPAEYMSKMFAIDTSGLEVISNDGAPSGSKEYLVWNPPLIDEMDPSLGKRSSLSEASKLMRTLMKSGLRVILFCKIRKAMKIVKADLSNEGRLDIVEKVRAYRGGYSREDRRKIEHEAFSGQLLGIIATNALELGIDIGALDAVIMLGFPMTVSNFRQQAGRAGRRSQDSLAIMVADPFPIDQHFVNRPSDLFENSLNDLIIDTDNELILEGKHFFSPECPSVDEKWFGSTCISICAHKLRKDDDDWYHPHPKFLPFPSRHVSIRGTQEETYIVVEVSGNDTQQSLKLEEVEFSRALFELYEGGVFMHQGETFIVKEVSHDSKSAKVVRADINYITSPRDLTRILPLQTFRAITFNNTLAEFGRLNVYVKVFGFFKIRNGRILDAVELITPPWERETVGFWIDLSGDILRRLYIEEIDGAAAIHAAEHAILNQYALSQDVKTDCRVAKEEYMDGNVPAKRAPRYSTSYKRKRLSKSFELD